MPRTRSTPEGAVLKACLSLLAIRRDVVAKAWRNNSGCLTDATGRPVRFGKVGSSDIIGCLWGGRFLAVECKAPGNRPTKAQRAFLESAQAAGAVALWVDDVAALAAALDLLAADPACRLTLRGEIEV